MKPATGDKPWYVLLVVVLGLLSWHLLTFHFEHLVDDAYISFRYADNLIQGHGLVFNAGARVEGYTNFLWTLLLAGLMFAGAEPVLAAKLLGSLFCLGTAVQTVRVSVLLVGRNLFSLVSILFLAVNGGYVLWASGGLETHLFALLIISGVWFHLRGTGTKNRTWAAVLFALATLTRPEGLLFAAITVGHDSFRRFRPSSGGLRFASIYAGLLLPYVAFKLLYYGDLLPNTFHAKAPAGVAGAAGGATYVGQFFSTGFHPLMLVLLFFLVWRRARLSWCTYLVLCVLSFSAYVVWIGGDSFPCFRFFIPVLPLLAVLAAAAFQAAHESLSGLAWFRTGPLLPLLLTAALVLALFHGLTSSSEGSQSRSLVPAYDRQEQDRLLAAAWFERTLPPTTSIALNPAGIVPYYTRFRTVDMLGLTDGHIARVNTELSSGVVGHLKFDANYVLDESPDLIVVGACKLLDGEVEMRKVQEYYRFISSAIPGDRALLLNDRLFREYRLVAARVTPRKFLPFFLSRTSPIMVDSELGLEEIAWDVSPNAAGHTP